MDSSQKEEEMRNWLDLPTEITSLIFLKLSAIDILMRAQWVCSAWRKISKEPQLYRTIDTRSSSDLWSEGMVREAVDRSCGQLLDLSFRGLANSDLLQYVSEKSTSLRCLRLVYTHCLTAQELINAIKKHSDLEELEFCHCIFSIPDLRIVGDDLCRKLKSFRLNYVNYWSYSLVAPAIAENMHELRHLDLFGNDKLMDDHLRTILDGCPHLESLDLRRCFKLEFGGDLKKRTANIKVRFPNDPTDDYDYEYEMDVLSHRGDCISKDYGYDIDVNSADKGITLEDSISEGYFSEDSDSDYDYDMDLYSDNEGYVSEDYDKDLN